MGVSDSKPDTEQEQETAPVPEPGGDGQPLPAFRGLVALGSEDAPACSDGICL